MAIEKCATCGKEFETKVIITQNKGKSFCSIDCFIKSK